MLIYSTCLFQGPPVSDPICSPAVKQLGWATSCRRCIVNMELSRSSDDLQWTTPYFSSEPGSTTFRELWQPQLSSHPWGIWRHGFHMMVLWAVALTLASPPLPLLLLWPPAPLHTLLTSSPPPTSPLSIETSISAMINHKVSRTNITPSEINHLKLALCMYTCR